MKRLFWTMFMTSLLLYTGTASAQVRPMTDTALAKVTGQSGISIGVKDRLDFDMKAKNIYYGNKDGFGPGSGTSAGYISLTDVTMKGSIAFATPMTIDVGTKSDADGIKISSVNMKLSDMTLKIDSFYIDAIRLGNSPGKGNSLGSFGIENMTVLMTGAITISAN